MSGVNPCPVIMHDGKPCNRSRYGAYGYCIFHLPEKRRHQISDFQVEYNKLLNSLVEEKKDFYDFTYFDFPIDISLGDTPSASFSHAIFRGKVIPQINKQEKLNMRFKSVDFSDAVFKNIANFSVAIFTDTARFFNTVFERDAIFIGVKFEKSAGFSNATFLERVSFDSAQFEDGVSFIWANFNEAHFSKTIINEAHFNAASFNSDTDFSNTKVNNKCHFDGALFKKNVNFNYIQGKSIIFENVQFLSSVTFIENMVETLIDFTQSTFEEQLIITRPDGTQLEYPYLFFTLNTFKKPRTILISGFPLSKTSFIATDTLNINLVPTTDQNIILSEKILNMAQEKSSDILGSPEITKQIIKRQSPFITHQIVELEYKLLRKCFENSGRHNEAAFLFEREMQLAYKDIKWRENPAEKISNFFYRLLSNYGESLNLAVALLLESIVGYSLFFCILLYGKNPDTVLLNLPDILTKVFAVAFQLRSFTDFKLEIPLAYEILARLTSLLFIGNIYIALRRRLERK